MTVVPIYDVKVEPWERLLTCCRCKLVWNVTELPEPFLDPAKYTCPHHLKPKETK